MKIPPIHLELIDLRLTIHLVAFIEYEKLGVTEKPESNFFLGFYIQPGKTEIKYYLLLVDESGLKQRCLTEAGDCIEYAVLIAMAMFPVTVLDVMAYQVVCNETLFSGHLSTKMAKYRKELKIVKKRLDKIGISYLRVNREVKR